MTDLSRAFHDLVDEVKGVERRFLDADPALPEADVLDGYRFAFSLLKVALEAYVWADTARPRFVDVITPSMKWGGDNSDAFYQLTPLDPERTEERRGEGGRVHGRADVGDESGQRAGFGADAAADRVGCLEHLDLVARAGQGHGGGEPVRAAADHRRACHGFSVSRRADAGASAESDAVPETPRDVRSWKG